MKRHEITRRKFVFTIAAGFAVWALAIAAFVVPFRTTQASTPAAGLENDRLYRRPAPDFDLNLANGMQHLRAATSAQTSALETLRSQTASPELTFRWNGFGGSPDVIYDFASSPLPGTPEEAARAFISQNAALFGVASSDQLRLFSSRKALGGSLVRFQQLHDGIPVRNGGIGVVIDKNGRAIMASGPFFRDVSVNTSPTLSAAEARQLADADLAQFSADLPDYITNLLEPGLAILREQAEHVNQLEPKLGIYPTSDGYRLVWNIAKFSTDPFGLYMVSVDAHSGEIVQRKDFLNFQVPNTGAFPLTADIYPKYPTITDELKDQAVISDCGGIPCGQERVQLRKFQSSNVVTGVNGTLTGTHALVNNALATKQPFGQAALGTWHFRNDNAAGLEARTNEQDHFAEPAEHQDEINAFFFITYLVEYIDYLHVAGDPGTFGSQGSFPDEYPNKTIPLPGTVHIPNIYIALDAADGRLPNPNDPNLAEKVLGLDNAFALNVTALTEAITGVKSPVVANPTSYGHGFYFNDLALEGTVPYHEGMHAITSPIAGLEGIEGDALNEGQADMWAFTITDNPSLGDYVVNAKGYRDLRRSRGQDPDAVAYIRSAESTLKYSDIATLVIGGSPQFEEHYDGEIYMSTLWDLREMLNRVYPDDSTYRRPQPKDGLAKKKVTKGTDIFERIFLGSMYILGTTSPDTMVKARDAMMIADQMLYPTDSTNPRSPGKHRAMIEQIFAAHELGVNALEVIGGTATISTQVTPFAGSQAAPDVPANVTVVPASEDTNRISWDGVNGAVAYEILRRRKGFENQREPNGIRQFNDGDQSTTGFRHIDYVDGNVSEYIDRGDIQEVFAPAGLDDPFEYEYVVRSIGIAPNGQMGVSDLSGAAEPVAARIDVTNAVESIISNVSFSNGVFAFDNRLKNTNGAGDTDGTIYGDINFEITSISDPTVTVRNPDLTNPMPTFVYGQNLVTGATSAAKRLEFNDPQARLFTFDARITGRVFTSSTVGTGSQPGDGTSDPPEPVTYSLFSEEITGTLLAGEPTATAGSSATWGDPAFKGITWDDFPVTTKNDALFLEATLSSMTAVDLDFELRTTGGQVLDSSGNIDSNEFVTSAVQPNTVYILRVMGFTNGPAEFTIVSKQLLPAGSPNENDGTRMGGQGNLDPYDTDPVSALVRFTVNPVLRTVSFRIL